jgi:putative transposase
MSRGSQSSLDLKGHEATLTVELGLPVADLVRQLGVSEQTFYRWKRAYGGLESEQVRELKQVVEENARLKKLVAELSLDKAVLQDVLSKKFPGRRS